MAIEEAARRGSSMLMAVTRIVLANDWKSPSQHGLSIVRVLSRSEAPMASRTIASLMKHPDRRVRWSAATERLAKKDATGLKLVGEALRDGNLRQKLLAAQVAANGGYRTLVPDLRAAQPRVEAMPMKDRSHTSPLHVGEVIRIGRGWLRDPLVLNEIRRSKSPTRDELRVIAAADGEKARPMLEACLDRSLWHRIVSLAYLTRLADRRSIPALRRAAKTNVPDEANSGIAALLHSWATRLAEDLTYGRKPLMPRLQVEDPFLRALHRIPK